jgi:L-fuconolactonase
VIDSHLHLWDPAEHEYPWLADEPDLDRAFLPSHLDTGGHDIDGFVVVEAGCRRGQDELGWLEHLAQTWPGIRGIVAQAPLELGPAVAPLLAKLCEHRLTVGVRRNVQDEGPGFMLAEPMVAGTRLLAGHGLTFDACVREHQLRELAELVDRCPEVTFVLDHLGKPAIAQHRGQPWFDDLAALARRPNVVAKLSGLTTEADHVHWRPADIVPYLSHALEQFGPARCMFGSDWPVATRATTYERWVDLVLGVAAELPDVADRTAILAGTAVRVYGLDPKTGEEEVR